MKKNIIIASLAVIGCAAVVGALALGGGSKLNAIFEAKATSKSFVFDAAAGSQFDGTAVGTQIVNVKTGSSSPIRTMSGGTHINSIAYGQNGRFVEAHPLSDMFPSYSLMIGINNLTHFEIDMGVENDVDAADTYRIKLGDEDGNIVKKWDSCFELDGNGNGTAHIEWDKGVNDSSVVNVMVVLSFENDSLDTGLYIESLSLTWDC